jgi:hypothetical protein
MCAFKDRADITRYEADGHPVMIIARNYMRIIVVVGLLLLCFMPGLLAVSAEAQNACMNDAFVLSGRGILLSGASVTGQKLKHVGQQSRQEAKEAKT